MHLPRALFLSKRRTAGHGLQVRHSALSVRV